jgi:hypothetical protein
VCWPLLLSIRPNLTSLTEFTEMIKSQQKEGYRVALLELTRTGSGTASVEAVAGYRIHHSLGRGRVLFVEELVARAEPAGNAWATTLWKWLQDHARDARCTQIAIDSDAQVPVSSQPGQQIVSYLKVG